MQANSSVLSARCFRTSRFNEYRGVDRRTTGFTGAPPASAMAAKIAHPNNRTSG